MMGLRRTRPFARPKYAWRLKAGDLIHTPSAVLEVIGVDNDRPVDRPTNPFTTEVWVINEIGGKEFTHALAYRPQQELRRVVAPQTTSTA
jgi:hypothetical protein